MEAHEAIGRFERMHGGAHEGGGMPSAAAVVVAVLAGFLAVATFLSNEQVKEVITGATKAATNEGKFETNDLKAVVAESQSTLLKVVGRSDPKAAARAMKLDNVR